MAIHLSLILTTPFNQYTSEMVEDSLHSRLSSEHASENQPINMSRAGITTLVKLTQAMPTSIIKTNPDPKTI